MPTDIKSIGTTLEYGDGTPDTKVMHVRSFSGPDGDTVDINTTDYDVTDDFQTFIAGMSDGGEITLTVKYDPTEFAGLYDQVGVKQDWTLTFNDGQDTPSSLDFKGYLKFPSVEFEDAEDDGLVTNELTIKVSGKPTFNAGGST